MKTDTSSHYSNNHCGNRLGFTLVEVVVAMGVLAMLLPLVYALIIQGGQDSRKADEDTRAVFTSRSVMQEVRLARQDVGEYITETPPWPQFPAADDWYAIAIGHDGQLIKLLTTAERDQPISDKQIAHVAKVRGVSEEIDIGAGKETICKVEIQIETPAQLPAAKRRKKVFYRYLHENE